MKSKILLLTTILLLAPVSFAKFSNPKCKSRATQKMWNKNQSGCLRAMRSTVEKKQITSAKAYSLCECISDETVNNLTCEQFNKIAQKGYFEQLTRKIGQDCRKKTGFTTPPKKAKKK